MHKNKPLLLFINKDTLPQLLQTIQNPVIHFLKNGENIISKGSVEERKEIQTIYLHRNTCFLILNCIEHENKKGKQESQNIKYRK